MKPFTLREVLADSWEFQLSMACLGISAGTAIAPLLLGREFGVWNAVCGAIALFVIFWCIPKANRISAARTEARIAKKLGK